MGAFKNCSNLVHITFRSDSKLRVIGSSAFKSCYNLQQFDVPPHLEFIGDFAFDGCVSLLTLDLRGAKICHVGQMKLYSSSMTIIFPPTVDQEDVILISEENGSKIEVAKSHTAIQLDSCGYFFSNGTIFKGNKKINHILIRHGVERIAKGCFYESNLVAVTIPSSVIEISGHAFSESRSLKRIRFTKDSRLEIIGSFAFCFCRSIKKIRFPKSLKIIKEGAFNECESLEKLIFPQDSQLETIEEVFEGTAIKHMSLPPSVREVTNANHGLKKLFVSNDLYQSNEEGTAIYSRDGSELVCVVDSLNQFEIPESVRIIKKRAFFNSPIRSLTIPHSVEVIEEEAFIFCYYLEIVRFQTGSRLKSLAFDAFHNIKDLTINNENFVKMENGVVMSLNPKGIVFVPRELTELEIPPGVEVIYSYAFAKSKIKRLKFPKSLKKIYSYAFSFSSLEIITFEEGTELEYVGNHVFHINMIMNFKLPLVNGDLEIKSLSFSADSIEFPPNLVLKNKELDIYAAKIVCPLSSLPTIAHFNYYCHNTTFIFKNDC